MDENKILEATVELVQEKPVVIPYTFEKLNFWQKIGVLPKKKNIIIPALTMGTLLKISGEILKFKGFDEYDGKSTTIDVGTQMIYNNGEGVIRILALAIHNKKSDPPKGLENFIRDYLTPVEISQLFTVVTRQMNLMPFMTTIIAVKGMSLMKKEETIAPVSGEQSEELLNTTDSDGMSFFGIEASQI